MTTNNTKTTRTPKGTSLAEIARVIKAVEDYVTAYCHEILQEARPNGAEAVEEAMKSCGATVIEFNLFKGFLEEFIMNTPKLDAQATETDFYKKVLWHLPEELKRYREKAKGAA